jgi:hypothetical protein
MPKRWSKLRSPVEDLFADGLRLGIHCTVIRTTRANDGSLVNVLGTFTVRLNGKAIWDFPKQFVTYWTAYPDGGNHYSYSVSDLNGLLREYLDTPKADLPEKKFVRDHFGLTDILKAADRRLGLERLTEYFRSDEQTWVLPVLEARRALTTRSKPTRASAARAVYRGR